MNWPIVLVWFLISAATLYTFVRLRKRTRGHFVKIRVLEAEDPIAERKIRDEFRSVIEAIKAESNELELQESENLIKMPHDTLIQEVHMIEQKIHNHSALIAEFMHEETIMLNGVSRKAFHANLRASWVNDNHYFYLERLWAQIRVNKQKRQESIKINKEKLTERMSPLHRPRHRPLVPRRKR